jgi:hypothetical protein
MKIVEWCSNCCCEVGLTPTMTIQRCPNCGDYIIPCSLCNWDSCDCNNCELDKECVKLKNKE